MPDPNAERLRRALAHTTETHTRRRSGFQEKGLGGAEHTVTTRAHPLHAQGLREMWVVVDDIGIRGFKQRHNLSDLRSMRGLPSMHHSRER